MPFYLTRASKSHQTVGIKGFKGVLIDTLRPKCPTLGPLEALLVQLFWLRSGKAQFTGYRYRPVQGGSFVDSGLPSNPSSRKWNRHHPEA